MKTMRVFYLGVLVFLTGGVNAAAPFGGEDDVNYANDLWQTMIDAGYAGPGSLMSRPYIGQHPHGAILDTFEGQIALKGELHTIIVKRNYGGEGVSIATVSNDPAKYLKAVTVMLKRPGYDPETKDWFRPSTRQMAVLILIRPERNWRERLPRENRRVVLPVTPPHPAMT